MLFYYLYDVCDKYGIVIDLHHQRKINVLTEYVTHLPHNEDVLSASSQNHWNLNNYSYHMTTHNRQKKKSIFTTLNYQINLLGFAVNGNFQKRNYPNIFQE